MKLGLVRQDVAETLPESEVIKFIFLPGFSTADAVGGQAGRGVGMDVVKRVIETMNGHIEVESVYGEGTKFTMHLPLTLLIATALLVRAGGAIRDSTPECARSHDVCLVDGAADGGSLRAADR